MARGFYAIKEVSKGKTVERAYELSGDKIVLLVNRGIIIPVGPTDAHIKVLEAHERKTHGSFDGELHISEFESFSGTYIPAISRPQKFAKDAMFNPKAADENEAAKSYRREHRTIAKDIEDCFDVAGPSVRNYGVFGAQFEKIIYFACVGVESLFNKILSENDLYESNANMKTFVRLRPHLRIDEYGFSLAHYPWIPIIKPFEGWTADQPSKSLPWFDAYNSLKHDKKNNQHKATMQNALSAAAGYYALTYAVFGNQMFTGFLSEQFFFHFESYPAWDVSQLYFPPPNGIDWQPRKLSTWRA